MDGVTAARRLREANFPNLIIGITGNVMDDDLEEYLGAGADAVFFKPIKILQIAQVMELARTSGPLSRPGHKLRLEAGLTGQLAFVWAPLASAVLAQEPQTEEASV